MEEKYQPPSFSFSFFFAISTILPNKGGLCPPGEKSSASENLKEIAPFYADHFEIFSTSPLIAALIFNFPFFDFEKWRGADPPPPNGGF